MNKSIGVIFAGGVGTRMNSKEKPKQFLEIHGKPIIIRTLEHFENCSEIDGVVISCVGEWIDYLKNLIRQFHLKKVIDVVPGGKSGQLSIYNGLIAAKKYVGNDDAVVLIHDGVRPLISSDLLTQNIQNVKMFGSCITTGPMKETVVLIDDNDQIFNVPSRNISYVAKAPQSFWLNKILSVHEKALSDGVDNSIDSCTLMSLYDQSLHILKGPYENIKITTPDDFYMMRAMLDAKENEQIYGYER
jgi:2-C-methyl-D-erythritol 4-phosphate cytidylyltransferase